MEIKDKYTLKEALAVIAKHMLELAKSDETSEEHAHGQYVMTMRDKTIGKTKTGKAIGGNFHDDKHKDFIATDHADASDAHKELANKTNTKHEKKYHEGEAQMHHNHMATSTHTNLKPIKGVN